MAEPVRASAATHLTDAAGADAGRANAQAWAEPVAAHLYRKAVGLLPPEQAILDLHAAEIAGTSVLDLGVGTGRTTPHLKARCKSYIGVDYASAMLEAAARRHPDAELYQADARNLAQWDDGSFGFVLFSYNGIDYVGHDDRLRILAEVNRVLRPGGLFVFSTHNRDVEVPVAWSPRNLHWSNNPARLAYNGYLYLVGIAHARKVRGLERAEDEYALTNDPGLRYKLVTYYITRPAQRAQLGRAGFSDVAAYAMDARPLAIDGPPVEDFMIHYAARKAR